MRLFIQAIVSCWHGQGTMGSATTDLLPAWVQRGRNRVMRGRSVAMPGCVALLLSLSPAPPLRAAPVELESRIEALAQQLMQRTGVPGVAIAVVQRDQPVLVKGFGVRQIGTPEPVDAHTLFPLASLSKPITSTVLAVVVGEGQVGWDDPATNQLPEFRLRPPAIAASVTLRDLLSHRSGLGDHAGDPPGGSRLRPGHDPQAAVAPAPGQPLPGQLRLLRLHRRRRGRGPPTGPQLEGAGRRA